MHTVINHIPVVAEHQEAFEAQFRASLVHMEGVPGFVRVDVWRPVPGRGPADEANPPAYMIQTVWKSAEAFRAWVGSDSFRASHREPMPDTWRAGAARMTVHELAFGETGS
ncbi:MAG: antibiotic biosynthesis monooxygenase family protein [Myxococcota bacterium]